MSDLTVIPIVHLGQPPGTSEKRLEQYALKVLSPLLDLLQESDGVRMGLHITGWLLKWLAQKQGPILKRLTVVVSTGRADVLGGGWTDPFLSGLPEADALGQIQLQARLTERWVRRRPSGMWLARCAWDPCLPGLMARNNLRYAAVDEGAWAAAGLPASASHSHLRTERAGGAVSLLPAISTPLTHLTDFEGTLERRARAGARLVCVLLPLERALSRSQWANVKVAFEAMDTHLTTMTPEEAVERVPSSGLGYLPPWIPASLHASTATQPPEGSGRPAPAPGWEAFLGRYSECNRLHKRMLLVSTQLGRLRAALRAGKSKRRDILEAATDSLYKSQAAEYYLHGDRPGIYDASLRHLAYADLDRAELAIRTALGEQGKLGRLRADVDCDGEEEVLIHTSDLRAEVSPARGGGLIALDLWGLPGNILNTMTRRPEPYHRQLDDISGLPALVQEDEAGEPGDTGDTGFEDPAEETADPTSALLTLARNLHYDRAERASFIDRFLDDSLSLQNMVNGRVPEIGDFSGGRYRLLSVEPHEILDACVVQMTREGRVQRGRSISLVQVAKRFIFHRDLPVVDARYELTNRSHTPLETTFAIELNLGLDARFARGARLSGGGATADGASTGVLDDVHQLSVADPHKRFELILNSATPMRVYHYPVICAARVGEAVKSAPQGICLLLVWPMKLWGHEKASYDLSLNIEAG